MKLYLVTQQQKVNKKTRVSKVVGFISVFGWESAGDKAARKYPELEDIQLHETKHIK